MGKLQHRNKNNSPNAIPLFVSEFARTYYPRSTVLDLELQNNFFIRRKPSEVNWVSHLSNQGLFRALSSYLLSIIKNGDSSLGNCAVLDPCYCEERLKGCYSAVHFGSWSTLFCKVPSPIPASWGGIKHLRTSNWEHPYQMSIYLVPCFCLGLQDIAFDICWKPCCCCDWALNCIKTFICQLYHFILHMKKSLY